MIHALFCLACPGLDQIIVIFAIIFADLIHIMDQEWNLLVASIREGSIPDLEGISHLRVHLQVSRRSKTLKYMFTSDRQR